MSDLKIEVNVGIKGLEVNDILAGTVLPEFLCPSEEEQMHTPQSHYEKKYGMIYSKSNEVLLRFKSDLRDLSPEQNLCDHISPIRLALELIKEMPKTRRRAISITKLEEAEMHLEAERCLHE